jgi:hypothetical protein
VDNQYIDSFPCLDALVGGWFHQDFDLAGGTLCDAPGMPLFGVTVLAAMATMTVGKPVGGPTTRSLTLGDMPRRACDPRQRGHANAWCSRPSA